jgi:hypothetical protein
MVSYCAHAPSAAPDIHSDQSRVRGARAQEATSPLSCSPSALYLFLLIQWDGARDCLPPRPLSEH